jgi:hypothetical protein
MSDFFEPGFFLWLAVKSVFAHGAQCSWLG